MEVEEMSKEMIFSLPQLQDLFHLTSKLNLIDIIHTVYGGNPSDYEKLWEKVKESDKSRETIGELLCDSLAEAIALKNDPETRDFIEAHKESVSFGLIKVEDVKVLRPSPDKVFRRKWVHGVDSLIPISNAMNIVLTYNLRVRPSFKELETLLK